MDWNLIGLWAGGFVAGISVGLIIGRMKIIDSLFAYYKIQQK